jgi:hypothetical protein
VLRGGPSFGRDAGRRVEREPRDDACQRFAHAHDVDALGVEQAQRVAVAGDDEFGLAGHGAAMT